MPTTSTSSYNYEEQAILEEARKQKELQEQRKKEIENWLRDNIETFNEPELVKLWEGSREKLIKPLLELVVSNLACVDAAQKVNEILANGLRMEDAQLDIRDFTLSAVKIFRIEVARLLLNRASLAGKTKLKILDRTIAREYPLKETGDGTANSIARVLREVNRLSNNGPEYIPRQKQKEVPSNSIRRGARNSDPIFGQ